jgi:hypothetical protein
MFKFVALLGHLNFERAGLKVFYFLSYGQGSGLKTILSTFQSQVVSVKY